MHIDPVCTVSVYVHNADSFVCPSKGCVFVMLGKLRTMYSCFMGIAFISHLRRSQSYTSMPKKKKAEQQQRIDFLCHSKYIIIIINVSSAHFISLRRSLAVVCRHRCTPLREDEHFILHIAKKSKCENVAKRISTLCQWCRTSKIIFGKNGPCIYLRTHIK